MKAERQTLVKIFNTSWQPSYLFLVSAACLAPTEKNSVITSSGIPLVSGTFTKTNTHDMRHTTAYKPKTPARPMDLSITGSVQVTMMSPIQNVRAHMAMQRPRTRVGKISAQRMLGIGPNPMTKKQKQRITLTVEIDAFTTLPISTRLPRTRMTRDTIKIGIVVSNKVLQWGKTKNKP